MFPLIVDKVYNTLTTLRELQHMADVISLGTKIKGPNKNPEEPMELVCLNCSETTFYIFPDSIVTCSTCKYIMELVVPYGTLRLGPPTMDG